MQTVKFSLQDKLIDFSLEPYQNFIFDCFGVIIAWDKGVKVTTQSDSHNPHNNEYKFKTLLQHPSMHAAEKGLITQTDALNIISHEHKVPYTQIAAMTKMTENSLSLVESCVNLIDELRILNKKNYCLTNMTQETYIYLNNKYNFWKKFDDVFISAELNLRKPDPEIFEYVLERHNLKANETIFIDDDPENTATARTLGITSIDFTTVTELVNQIRSICLTK